jgi:large subunit ribosomal protein L35
MERIYQMNVVPDVLPVLRPSVDLRVSFPRFDKEKKFGKYENIEPGIFLLPADVSSLAPFLAFRY